MPMDASRLSREERKKVTKLANRARHRLASIRNDYHNVVKPAITSHPGLPVLCNERCGSWYLPYAADGSCYFKSTDGHADTWNISLKRLNLDLIATLHESSACLLLDASKSKQMPDSFSRTLPIWCAVMNRIALRYRQELGLAQTGDDGWDIQLHTPWTISLEEHEIITNLLEDRVDLLYRSHAIVDPMWLVTILQKPLRPCWITPKREEMFDDVHLFYRIICVNCSDHCPDRCFKESFWYTPGAADDHELWGRHLIPRLFWDNVSVILDSCNSNDSDNEVDAAIDKIVANNLLENENAEASDLHHVGDYDAIGETTDLYLGTRRAGRPPRCWSMFDAILNVTDMEYPEMSGQLPDGKFYLQLKVKEGKRDKTELEKWMSVGIVFCIKQLQSKRKVLIHCAQGKDRSAALTMAVSILCFELQYPLKPRKDFGTLSLDRLFGMIQRGDADEEKSYCNSGLPTWFVETMLGQQGRTLLLDWYCSGMKLPVDVPFATKETIRVALHLIQQYREKADPSRSTIQKLNRFFMSSPSKTEFKVAHA